MTDFKPLAALLAASLLLPACLIEEDGLDLGKDAPDDVLSAPFEAALMAVHYDTIRQRGGGYYGGDITFVGDVTLSIHDKSHPSYCMLGEERDVPPLYGGGQVLVELEVEYPAVRDTVGEFEPGDCPIGEYLVSNDDRYLEVDDFSVRHGNLSDGEAMYRRWSSSGEIVSAEPGRTGYVRFYENQDGSCQVYADINLGKRIHAVYDTAVFDNFQGDNMCDHGY